MLRLVIAYKTKATKEPDILYLGHFGDDAQSKMDDALKGKEPPYSVEMYQLSTALKRRFNSKPSKEELELAKKRDEKEKLAQKALIKEAEGEPDKPKKEDKKAK